MNAAINWFLEFMVCTSASLVAIVAGFLAYRIVVVVIDFLLYLLGVDDD